MNNHTYTYNERQVYKGIKDVHTTEEQWASLYQNLSDNVFELLNNQYVIVRNKNGEIIDKLAWENGLYRNLSHRKILSYSGEKIKPKNTQQECAFDMLQNNNTSIKVLTGRFGSGKTFLMVAHALHQIHEGKVQKIVWVRNNVSVKDTEKLGALPGTELEKLLPFVGPLMDHVGGIGAVDKLIQQKKLDIQHLGFIRGRDIKNSIILCSEAENLTKQHVQLLIGRVGTKSQLWLDGDFKQVDGEVFTKNGGLKECIDKLKGHRLFGYVNLEVSERSETAALADLLD